MAGKTISTDKAPQAIGPYSQANIAESSKLLFCSGQIPLDPATGKLVEGDVAAQTEQVLQNLTAVLQAAGSSLEQVVKTTVYLKDMNDFTTMNEIYSRFFKSDYPARAAVQVARLPLDVSIEIEAIATVE